MRKARVAGTRSLGLLSARGLGVLFRECGTLGEMVVTAELRDSADVMAQLGFVA